MKFNDFNWKDVIYEAPGDPEDDELSASDYTDAEDVDVEPTGEEEDLGAEDYTESESDEESEDGEEDLSNENEEDMGEDEGFEDEDSSDMGEDDSSNDEQIDNEKNKDKYDVKQKNKYLINDFIELHTRQGEILNKIKKDKKFNAFTNPTVGQVKKNLEKLQQVTYDYIIDKFSKESYIANLYQFNLIIQAMNVNVGMLERVADGKLSELEKKKKTTKKKSKKD